MQKKMSLKPDALSKAPQFLSAPFLDTIFYFRSTLNPFFLPSLSSSSLSYTIKNKTTIQQNVW
jgi:hypothetical protein